MICQRIRQEAIVLIPVPSIKPKKDPKAATKASFEGLLPQYTSARKAPKNEPAIIPIGVRMIPAKRPNKAPLSAYLLPPVSFVKYIGTT